MHFNKKFHNSLFLSLLILTTTLLFLSSCSDDNPATIDDQNSELTLSITSEPETLIESQEEAGILTLVLDDIPEEDLPVPISVTASDGSSKPLARFKIATFNPSEDIQGATLAEQPNPSELNRLVLLMNEQVATIILTVNDDDFDDGPLNVTFVLQESEDYLIDEENNSAAFRIIEE